MRCEKHTQSFQIKFEPMDKRIDASPNMTILEAARQAGMSLSSACGGAMKCGQCRVGIIKGDVSPPSDKEITILGDENLIKRVRLACCTYVLSDMTVTIPKTSLVTEHRLQLWGDGREVGIEPVVQTCRIHAPPPGMEDLRSDLARITDTLHSVKGDKHFRSEPYVIRQLSSLAREFNWDFNVHLRNGEIIGATSPGAMPVGLAVDLGTTKIAAGLVDMSTGAQLTVAGALNPQVGYGEDVMSRLAYGIGNEDGAGILASTVREAIDDLLDQLAAAAEVDRTQVTDVCIVGNTAMTHLLVKLPIHQLAVSPFTAATNAAVDIKARELGVTCAPGAYVHILPCIGGFIGADHVAMILACGFDRADHTVIGIDIGTNTEIVLFNPAEQVMTAVSCASGPAFEGVHISDGMRASTGAIEAVTLSESGCTLKTIDQKAPMGLCGSGIIDAVAELHRLELINSSGRLNQSSQRVRRRRRGWEFLLVSKEQSGSGQEIVLSQADINEVQLAKGAIRAGLEILLEATATDSKAVKEVIIAGAFGSFLNVDNTLDIGLIPSFPNAGYHQVGNAAMAGARMALLSRHERERAQQIAAQCTYLELTTYPKFNRHFAKGMLFPKDTG